MAARKAKAYRVVGAAAVIRKDGHERYVYRNGVFAADALDEANAKHLLSLGLIEADNSANVETEAEAEAAAQKAAEEEAAAQQRAAKA